jgi:hypothetical protein
LASLSCSEVCGNNQEYLEPNKNKDVSNISGGTCCQQRDNFVHEINMKRGVVDVVVVGVVVEGVVSLDTLTWWGGANPVVVVGVVVEGVVSLDTLTWWGGANPVVVVGVVVEGVVLAEEDSTEEDEREEGVGNFFSSILLRQRLVLVVQRYPVIKCRRGVFVPVYVASCVC